MLKEKSMAEKKLEKNSNFRNVKKNGKVEIKDLIDSGVHFGHLTRKWNPICRISFILRKMVFI